jgi:hypothetical protein
MLLMTWLSAKLFGLQSDKAAGCVGRVLALPLESPQGREVEQFATLHLLMLFAGRVCRPVWAAGLVLAGYCTAGRYPCACKPSVQHMLYPRWLSTLLIEG